MPTVAAYDAVLLDIEGTTTSIAFVYEVLFPFARREVAGFVDARWGDPALQEAVAAVAADAGRALETPGEVVAAVREQMDSDAKLTGLKALQGQIWVAGYESGELKGHVYEDVLPALERWKARDVPVYIYSSGSVAAQKLLFGSSEAGDLLPLLAGHFDTTTGPKKVASSYVAIAEAIGVAPERVLFLTDNLAEAEAAREAGVHAVISVRPGNPELPEHSFETVTSFEQLEG